MAKFMYFGLRFCCSELQLPEIDGHLPPKLTIKMVEEMESNKQMTGEVNQFVKAIKDDMRVLNLSNMGGKSNWKSDGYFMLLKNSNVYLYYHSSYASCSKVMFSQIESSLEFCISEPEFKLLEKECRSNTCEHSNHYRLEPFFMDNPRLIELYSMDQNNEAKTVLDEVREFVQRGSTGQESEFQCPSSRVHSWKENDWTRRLYVGIKKTFTPLGATYGAGLGVGQFDYILQNLGVGSVDQRCFIFRGFPDIILHNNSVVYGGGGASTSTSADASDTSGDDSIIENSWHRPPLCGDHDTAPPEKMGELIAALYILLVAKILRKVLKKKSTNRIFEVKGVLLDKAAAGIVCCLSVNFTPSGGKMNIKEVDYMGRYFDSSSLCYLIRVISPKLTAKKIDSNSCSNFMLN